MSNTPFTSPCSLEASKNQKIIIIFYCPLTECGHHTTKNASCNCFVSATERLFTGQHATRAANFIHILSVFHHSNSPLILCIKESMFHFFFCFCCVFFNMIITSLTTMFDSGHFLALGVFFTESRSSVAYRDSGLFISLASAHLQTNTHPGGGGYQLKAQFSYSDSHNTTVS